MKLLLLLFPALLAAQSYDIVLKNGRVMDPESGLDAVRYVGITGKKITAISARPLRGKTEVDATGLVIAPGFIDLHQHAHTPEAYRYKAMDGVTTALELEIGAYPLSEWYATREGKSLIHFGASAGHIPARIAVTHDKGKVFPTDEGLRAATTDEQTRIQAAVRKSLDEGGLGMGLGIAYTPNASPSEILNLFYLAAAFKRPVFVHMRSTGDVIGALQEVVADSITAGTPVHVMHLNSAAGLQTREALRFLDGIWSRKLDVTTEMYPFIAGQTRIESALYAGWENRSEADYATLLWPATGERLNRDSFLRYRKQGGPVIRFTNTEEMIHLAIHHPAVMIASDGRIEDGIGHPRAAGTFARVLGKYVREDKALTLMDAIRKSTIMPAQRLEAMAPQMRQKGRVKVGADADISVFDPNTVIDKATFEKPAQYSDGFRYVLVSGTFVVRDGKLQENATPGEGIRAR